MSRKIIWTCEGCGIEYVEVMSAYPTTPVIAHVELPVITLDGSLSYDGPTGGAQTSKVDLCATCVNKIRSLIRRGDGSKLR